MILSFKTKINNKPTYFVDKIIKGLHEVYPELIREFLMDVMVDDLMSEKEIPNFESKPLDECKSKLHTIRKDDKNRWKSGTMIDFFINTRQKDMFRFAPKINLISKQNVYMTYLTHCGLGFRVSVDGRELDEWEIENLALNDGFDAVEDFEDYFIKQMKDCEYSAKILHWTNLRY